MCDASLINPRCKELASLGENHPWTWIRYPINRKSEVRENPSVVCWRRISSRLSMCSWFMGYDGTGIRVSWVDEPWPLETPPIRSSLVQSSPFSSPGGASGNADFFYCGSAGIAVDTLHVER